MELPNRRQRKEQGLVIHHIFPRRKRKKPARKKIENPVVAVDPKRHILYHQLFFNLPPDEAVEKLVNEFFGGQWKLVEQALARNARSAWDL